MTLFFWDDKASYPTVMQYKKSLLEIHDMPILTNVAHTDPPGLGQILAS